MDNDHNSCVSLGVTTHPLTVNPPNQPIILGPTIPDTSTPLNPIPTHLLIRIDQPNG